ncbi:MAG TPA: TIGR04282 family arsenosugar biosynthesis glycosyltransferase [Gammaproteobacteria bacterium]
MSANNGFDVHVLVFARAPVPGKVKTRLAVAIGDDRAAALHADLLQRAVATAVAAGLGPVTLCCTPDVNHPCFEQAASAYGIALTNQEGADLGERMYGSLTTALAGAAAAIVIGCDCPFIDTTYLGEAAAFLAGRHTQVVIGPAVDGGYVLLGASRLHPSLFEDVPWGRDRVLAVTRNRLEALGWSWRELAPLHDIDRPEDIALLEDRPHR